MAALNSTGDGATGDTFDYYDGFCIDWHQRRVVRSCILRYLSFVSVVYEALVTVVLGMVLAIVRVREINLGLLAFCVAFSII